MTNDTVWQVLSSKSKAVVQYPQSQGELEDILNFGFSYVEHEDHVLEYIIADPMMIKRIIREIDEFSLCADKPYIGELWTAKVYITGKIKNSSLFFSNIDFSVVLNLHLNRGLYANL